MVIYFLVIFFVGSFLNSLVIFLVWKFKKLWTMHVAVSMQIVVLDLFIASIASIPPLANVLAYRWLFGSYVCTIIGFLSFCTKSVRTILMLVMVIDRFLSVFSPFFYPKHKQLACHYWLGWLLFYSVLVHCQVSWIVTHSQTRSGHVAYLCSAVSSVQLISTSSQSL